MFFDLKPHNGKANKLTGAVREYMSNRYNLLPEYLDRLRYIELDGTVNGRQVKRIRIFNPYKARELNITINSNEDLEQHPDMLLFEGYIDCQGNVYVADRRPPIVWIRPR
jgi:hypothetical protein